MNFVILIFLRVVKYNLGTSTTGYWQEHVSKSFLKHLKRILSQVLTREISQNEFLPFLLIS